MKQSFILNTGMAAVLLCIALLLMMASCKKADNTVQGSGCISRVPLTVETSVTPAQTDSISALFAKNNLPTDGLVFTLYNTDIPSYIGTRSTVVQAAVSANGLNGYDLIRVYAFTNDTLTSQYPETFLPVNNDTTARLTLNELQQIFLKHVSESHHTLESLIASTGPPIQEFSAEQFKDSCLKASFGYIDAIADYPNSVPAENYGANKVLRKAWKITPADNTFPIVFADDETGKGWGVGFY